MRRGLYELAASLAVFLLCVLTIDSPAGRAQTTSTWLSSFSSGSWFDSTRWDNGVPSTAGDIARFPAALSRNIQLNQQVTVGQVDFFGSGQVNITGAGLLVLDRPGNDPALLQTVPASGAGVSAVIGSPISI